VTYPYDPNQPQVPQQPAWGQAPPQQYPQYPQQPAWGQAPPPPQQPAWGQPYTPGQMPGQMPGWTPPRPQYEFQPHENAVLAKLATWAKFLAIVLYVQAVGALVGRNVLGAGIDLAIGLSFWGGAKSLQAVVETQGNDVTHLMTALDKLSTVFTFRIVLMAIAGVVILGCLAVALVIATQA
jgi:hypothetical protein